jgi:60S ribosomal subunit assembly/export protein LOC1
MAPKPPASKTATKVNNKNPKARKSATSGPSTIGKSKVHRPTKQTKQIKTKPTAASQSAARAAFKKKQRVYTDKELNLPTLNMITPAGVTQPTRGKKKGKVFIDDRESMMTILALVNAQKEGQIESKIMRERQLEEVREARRKEAEKRKEGKREILEGKMAEVKRKKGPKGPPGRGDGDAKRTGGKGEDATDETSGKRKPQNAAKSKKRVSFA